LIRPKGIKGNRRNGIREKGVGEKWGRDLSHPTLKLMIKKERQGEISQPLTRLV